jgi:predicted component of type VI protein secretion system
MTVSNIYGQKSKYRITLELDVLDDFNPRQINWRKVLQIEENEDLDCYIEDIDSPLDYYNWSD